MFCAFQGFSGAMKQTHKIVTGIPGLGNWPNYGTGYLLSPVLARSARLSRPEHTAADIVDKGIVLTGAAFSPGGTIHQ